MRIPRDAWGCSGMLGDARGCTGMHGDAWGCTGMHGDAWGCTGMQFSRCHLRSLEAARRKLQQLVRGSLNVFFRRLRDWPYSSQRTS